MTRREQEKKKGTRIIQYRNRQRVNQTRYRGIMRPTVNRIGIKGGLGMRRDTYDQTNGEIRGKEGSMQEEVTFNGEHLASSNERLERERRKRQRADPRRVQVRRRIF